MPSFAKRLDKIPAYAFAEMDRVKQEAKAKGVDVISLTIGDPDLPTPDWVIEELHRCAKDPETHRYPPYEGEMDFRKAVSEYYSRRFGVDLDPKEQVMAVIGSKEGLSHLIWGFVDEGDVVLVPDPAYPVYKAQTLLSGGTPYPLPLTAENDYLPRLGDIPRDVLRRTKLLFLNYPNNPTGAAAPLSFFEDVVRFAKEHGIIVCHDAAYVEMTYGDEPAPSILQVPGASEVAVEFYSLSKPFNMTGWRIGAAVGSCHALKALGEIKTNTDSGQFAAIQRAGALALRKDPEEFIASMNRVYSRRREVLVAGLRSAGWEVRPPEGTFYLWARIPYGDDDARFCTDLLEATGVQVSPGSAWGEMGRGYVRMTFTVAEDRLREAVERVGTYLKNRSK